MGDPRKHRRKYSRPTHPWKIERIDEENALVKEFGLKNKKEIWIAKSTLKGYRQQARQLLAATGEEAEKEKNELVTKLKKLGILKGETLEDILGLHPPDLLERRLQTIVFKKGLAKTPKQARQYIVHKKVRYDGRIVNVPSHLIVAGDEDKVALDEVYAKKVAANE